MVKFRMSMKSDKSDKPNHHSIQPKDAIAIVPPKKVIKALYDWSAPDQSYLSFSQGDFLHVVGREDDPQWYEACNPLQGSRGLVPVSYFEIVGKQARNSGGSGGAGGGEQHYIPLGGVSSQSVHDSGYGSVSQNGSTARLSKDSSGGGKSGAMVYGVVMYDFKAERPDELEAKEGEAIIVIAQSNPEWFVAKPITRLGGPGLIPVSFVEIRDMATNTPVEDPQDAVRRAGVPKVEEWKKMAADYKNGSIPLGKLDSGNPAQGLQQSMARLSLGQGHQLQQNNPYPNMNGFSQGSNGSQYGQQQYGQPQSQQNGLLAPLQASVPRYCFADDTFWFIVVVEMEDGRWWELQRLYQDFYDLQINLITEFPREAGNVKGVERSLPYMPGPVTYVTDNISNGRRANLDEYIRSLLKLGTHITKGFRVRKFFAPKEGDYEIDPTVSDPYRISTGSMDPGNTITPQSSGTFSQGFGGNPARTSQPPMMPHQGGHVRNLSTGTAAHVPGGTGQAHKIKVWFGPDNCVVIKMPPAFRLVDLMKKLQERRALEPGFENDRDAELDVLYREESDGKLYRMQRDEDLQGAIERNSKLTLEVRSLR